MRKIILVLFASFLFLSVGTIIFAASCDQPTGDIISDKSVIKGGEKVTITLTGYDDNRVGRLQLCQDQDCQKRWPGTRIEYCRADEKIKCSRDFFLTNLTGEGIYTIYGMIQDQDSSYGCRENKRLIVNTAVKVAEGKCKPPTAEISVDKKAIFKGEDYKVTVSGRDDNDIRDISLYIYKGGNLLKKLTNTEYRGLGKDEIGSATWGQNDYQLWEEGEYTFVGQVLDSDDKHDCIEPHYTDTQAVTITVTSRDTCDYACKDYDDRLFSSGDCQSRGFPMYTTEGQCFYNCSNRGETTDSEGLNCLCYNFEPCFSGADCTTTGCEEEVVPPGVTPPGTTPPGTTRTTGGLTTIKNPLQYDTVEQILGAVSIFLLQIGISLATVMLIIAGFMFVTSGGDPGRVLTARKMAIYTLIGLAIILLASGLIAVLKSIIGYTG